MPENRATTSYKTSWGRLLSAIALITVMALIGCDDTSQTADPTKQLRDGLPGVIVDGNVSVTSASVTVTYPRTCDSSGLPDDSTATSNPCLSLPPDGAATLSIGVTDNRTDGDVAIRVEWLADCGTANLTPAADVTTTGERTITSLYSANGCTGVDQVTARIVNISSGVEIDTVGSVAIMGNVPVAIQFISATPAKLDIAGTGGQTQATVKFRVLGESENPVAGEQVSFYLSANALAAGVEIIDGATQGVTNAVGDVITRIVAGEQTTPIVVTAVLDSNTSLTAPSDSLSVTGGPPVAGGFVLALHPWNPDAWLLDNVKVNVVATLSDRNGQSVPDGTTVVFTTESGTMIPDFCQTTNSRCNVEWTSNPANHTTGGTNTSRATIMGIVDGAERFDDFGSVENQFDDLDGFDTEDPSFDLGDFYRDDYADDNAEANTFDPERVDGDGIFEAVFTVNGNSPDVDVDGGGLSRAEEISPNGDGFYNGPFCSETATGLCATLQPPGTETAGGTVRLARSAVISVSSSRGYATTGIYDCSGNLIDASYLASQGCDMNLNGSILDIEDITGALNVNGACIDVRTADQNGNALPYGSTVTGAITKGAIIGSIAGNDGKSLVQSIPGTVTGAYDFRFGLRTDEDPGRGTFEVTTKTGEYHKVDSIPICEAATEVPEEPVAP